MLRGMTIEKRHKYEDETIQIVITLKNHTIVPRPPTQQPSLAHFAQRGIDYFEREFDPATEAY